MPGPFGARKFWCGLASGFALLACHAVECAEPEIRRNVEYVRRGDRLLHADVYLPAGDGIFPGVLLVHGGGWMSGSKLQVYGKAMQLVKRDYVVVAINYRLAPRYKFPAQIDDCHAALRWMRDNARQYRIDSARIAGFGYSAGGHLVSLLGMREANDDRDRLQAIVAGGAPCDFRKLPSDSRVLAYWLGGSQGDLPDVYHDASPSAYVSAGDPPVFLYHGEKDRLVSKIYSERMHGQLKRHGVRTKIHFVPDAGHLKAFFDREATGLALDFLDGVLKSAAPVE